MIASLRLCSLWLRRAAPDFTSTKITSSIRWLSMPLKTRKSIGAPMNFASVGLKGNWEDTARAVRRTCRQYRARALYGCLLRFGKFVRSRLFSHEPADLVHEIEGGRDEEDKDDDRQRRELGNGGHVLRVAWRRRMAEGGGLGWNKLGSRLLWRCSRLRERRQQLEAAPAQGAAFCYREGYAAILKLKDCFSCNSIQNEKLWVFLPGSPKPLNLCSRLLFCPAVLFYPQEQIAAEAE